MLTALRAARRVAAALRPYRTSSLLILGGLVLEMAFNSAVPFSFKFIIDRALIGGDRRALIGILAGLGAGLLVIALTGFGRDRLYARVVASIMHDLRAAMFQHLQRLSLDYFARVRVGDVLAHFSADLAVIETAAASAIAWAILPGLDVLCGTVLLFVLDWRLALVAMLVWPMALLGPRAFASRVAEESYRRKQDEADMLSVVQEHVGAQPVIKAFGLADYAAAAFLGKSEALRDRMIRVGFFAALVERSAGIGIMVLQVMILGIGAFMVSRQHLTVGSLASFQAIFLSLSYSLSYVTQYVPMAIQAAGGLRRVDDLLAEAPRIADTTAAPLPRLAKQIALRHVSFGYTPGRFDLRDASLTIERGRSVAFVGPSGSGKSTILNLVMRFYDPGRGTVAIDGVDLRHGAQESLRSQMGCVFQESFLFNTSVRQNIRLGRREASDAEVEMAARAAEIHDAVVALPEGYDTVVGERGGRLSGGQRQRLAIARAILRDPEILILDEATSALDPATESAINATLRTLARGRTALMVTHRLASVVDSDHIVVLEGGRVQEEGRHEDLLARRGLYRRLWDKQSGFALTDGGERATVTAERLRAIPIFAEMERHLLEESTALFGTDQYPAGRIVAQEGDVGHHMYIVVHGTVEVLKSTPEGGSTRVAVLQDGDHFGEIALLRAGPRTATVRTLTACIFLTLRREHFDDLLGKVPALRGKLEAIVEQRAAKEALASASRGGG